MRMNSLFNTTDLEDAVRNHIQYMHSCCGRESQAAAELAELKAELDRRDQVDKAYQLAVSEAVAATEERNQFRAELDERGVIIDCMGREMAQKQVALDEGNF